MLNVAGGNTKTHDTTQTRDPIRAARISDNGANQDKDEQIFRIQIRIRIFSLES